jgi:long-chain acyl-CoA synthetase
MRSTCAHGWLYEHAERSPDAPCVGTPSGWLTYDALAARVRALAASMSAAGLHSGDVFVTSLPDGPASVAVTLAAQSLGACVGELNRDTTREVFLAIVEQTGARFAAIAGRDAAKLAGVRLNTIWVNHPKPPTAGLCAALGSVPLVWTRDDASIESASEHVAAEPAADAPALLVYTSGSTGAPRAVVQTHRNIQANTRAIVTYLELTTADRACLILPLSYCYGKSVLLTHLFAGGSVYFDGRFMYPRVVLEAIGSERCTGFAGVPLTFELLKRQVDVKRVTMTSLRYVTQAGGAMHPDTIDWSRDAFAPAPLFVMYGTTRASS